MLVNDRVYFLRDKKINDKIRSRKIDWFDIVFGFARLFPRVPRFEYEYIV
jgi:hypothetical protein